VQAPAGRDGSLVENVELVQAAIDGYNARDAQALRRVMTADVELRPPVSSLAGRAYRGHRGIDEWLADVKESFANARIEALELRDMGHSVLALTSFNVRGSGSRMELESELGVICRIQEGRIATWQGFFSHADAIAASQSS
jgi:ketosteroid isomerase-like protein